MPRTSIARLFARKVYGMKPSSRVCRIGTCLSILLGMLAVWATPLSPRTAPAGAAAEPTLTLTKTMTSPPPMTPQVITFQQGMSPSTSYAGVDDTYLNLLEPDGVHGQEGVMRMHSDGRYRPLMRFDMSEYIPHDSAIVRATLSLWLNYANPDSTYINSELFLVRRAWTEETATWKTPWSGAGCSGVPTDREGASRAADRIRQQREWASWDITEMVQEWVSGAHANEGMLLLALPGQALRDMQFRSSEFDDGDQRPKLVVEYYRLPPTATPTASPSATPTPTTTITPTPSPTATVTPAPTSTATVTPVPTSTATSMPTPSPTATSTATRPSETFAAYLAMVLKSFWPPGPAWTATATPTGPPVATDTPTPPSGEGTYLGSTNQGKRIELDVHYARSAVAEVEMEYFVSCGGISVSGKTTISSLQGWSITDRAFRIESGCRFDLSGTFDPSWQSVSGTWQGIICESYGSPPEEVCRGPIGSWSATRQ